jgi:alpha-amylase
MMRKLILLIVTVLLLGSVGIVPLAAQDEFEPQWWHETTWYLLFVRSFYDSDGDGIGDIQGVIEKLDYLNDGDPETTDDLGITGIWLMPIMEAESYHGYDTLDYRTLEQDYGTNEDFQQLIEAAHARGIRVVIDLVLNHTSDAHPWFEASVAGDETYSDWYVWEDENPGYLGPWGQNVWYSNAQRNQFYYAVFWSRMPDLNHENPAVTAEIYDVGRFWIEDMGADGFRLDAIRYLTEPVMNDRPILADAPDNRAYLAEFSAYIHSLNPDAYIVGEVLLDTQNTIARYTNENTVDQAWDFPLADAIIASASGGNKREVEHRLNTTLLTYEPGDFATLTTNHDMPRLLTTLVGNIDANRVVANLLLTMPGTPYIYYGEEIGMMGGKPDELIRRPMQWDDTPVTGGFTSGTPWQPLDENFATSTVAAQSDDPDSLLSHYRNLIHLRNAHPALQYGETILVDSSYRATWGYLRYTTDETLFVVHNLDDNVAEEYTFTIEESPFTGFTSAELIFSTHEAEVALPELNEQGGFVDYIPIATPLPPFSLYVIRLQ